MSTPSLVSSFTSAAPTVTLGTTSPPNPSDAATCTDYGIAINITGTALPAGPSCNGCYGGLGPQHAIGAGPVDAQTWPRILSCCNGKQISVESNGCTAWCQADEGQLQSLWNCFYNADGTLSSGFEMTSANACDEESSAAPLGPIGNNLTCKDAVASSTTSNMASATLSATSSPTHSGAAVALRPRSTGKMQLALGSLVLLSLLTGGALL